MVRPPGCGPRNLCRWTTRRNSARASRPRSPRAARRALRPIATIPTRRPTSPPRAGRTTPSRPYRGTWNRSGPGWPARPSSIPTRPALSTRPHPARSSARPTPGRWIRCGRGCTAARLEARAPSPPCRRRRRCRPSPSIRLPTSRRTRLRQARRRPDRRGTTGASPAARRLRRPRPPRQFTCPPPRCPPLRRPQLGRWPSSRCRLARWRPRPSRLPPSWLLRWLGNPRPHRRQFCPIRHRRSRRRCPNRCPIPPRPRGPSRAAAGVAGRPRRTTAPRWPTG